MRRIAALAFLALTLWVVLARPDWARRLLRPPTAPNLLLVTLDTLRADRLGCYGYAPAHTPSLDSLAQRGWRFTQATTVVPLTLPAHASLFTGTFPSWHGVRDNGGFYLHDEHVTLAETLKSAGYRTGAFIGAFVLDRRWGIAQGFDRFFDEFDLESFGAAPGMDAIQRPGSEVVDQALAWLGADQKQPFFAWIHIYDPHTPYAAPEPYRVLFPRTPSGAYDAEIATADAQVGRLLDALARNGRLEDTFVVALADHGEMLGEHGELTHGFFVYESATRIPLIVAGPGLQARTIGEQVRIVDVMPTILELLQLKPPAAVQGVSVTPLARGAPLALLAQSESWYPRYHYGWSELHAIQDGRFKYIRAPRPELYDLRSDPGEANDLSQSNPKRLAAFETALAAHLVETRNMAAAKGPRSIDPETEERLAALGYLGSSLSRRLLDEQPRGDPKDKIGLYTRLRKAAILASEDRVQEAIAQVQRALREDSAIVEAHMLLGNFQKKARQPELAIEAYRRALALDGEHREALYALAVAYKELGRLDEARTGFERARELDPRNGRVLWQLADLLMRQKKPREAEAVIRDGLARKIDEHRFLLKLGESYIEDKRYDEAEKMLLEALAKKPQLATAHFNLGLIYEAKQQRERAIAAYEAELKHNAKAHRAAFNLGRLLQNAGRGREAVARFRLVVELEPGFGTGQLFLAKALLDVGDLAEAERWALNGLAANPDRHMTPLGHLVLADVYNRQGRTAKAEREVAKAQKLQKGKP